MQLILFFVKIFFARFCDDISIGKNRIKNEVMFEGRVNPLFSPQNPFFHH